MRKFFGAILPKFLFILSCAVGATAQSAGVVRGTVADANGAAVSGAEVVIKRADVRFERMTLTDKQGAFEFADLAAGNYRLTAAAKEFGATTKTVQVANLGTARAHDKAALVLTLAPRGVKAEVLVTSASLAGTPESLTEVPGTIERVDAQTLANSRVFNFSEALRKVTGVNVRDEEGFGLRPNIGIRGTLPTRSTKVLLLEDSIPLSYAPYGDNASYYHPPVERYESIEVLKGAGQIAYGPVTVAGVINYLTPNPPTRPSGAVRLEGGNRQFFNGGATFGDTLGKVGLLLNYNRKQGAGARENTHAKLNDISSKLTYNLNARNLLSGKFAAYTEDSNVTYAGLTEAEFRANPRGNVFRNDFFTGRRYGYSLQHIGVLTPKATLTNSFYGSHFARDWWRQSSNSAQRPNRLNVDPNCRSLADLYTTCGNEGRLRKYRIIGFESRLNAGFALGPVRNEFSGGFRVHSEHQHRQQVNGEVPDARTGTLAEFNLRHNLAYAGFVQNRFLLGDFAITPGVRVERVAFRRENRLVTPTASGTTALTQVIPGLGVAYSGLRRTTLFAGVHRGFAPPRTEDIISNTGGVIDLAAELSWNYEIGARSRPVRGVVLEGAFFRNDYENQIVPASLAGGVGATLTNGGQTLQQGFELNSQVDTGAIFQTRHNIYLRMAYTHLAVAEFRGQRFSSVTPSILVTGNRLPYAPETLLTASLGYAHPVGFDAFLESVYVGRQFADDLNTVNPIANGQRGAIPSQTYWNATANYKVEKWHAALFFTVKNIFDRTFVVDRTRGILPSSPRLAQAGVKFTF